MVQTSASIIYQGGFKDPVFEAQDTFRAIMKAMAEPGLIVRCAKKVMPPKPLFPLTGAVISTLCDGDTPLYIKNCPLNETAIDWIKFHSEVPLVSSFSKADFAFFESLQDLPNLENFALGSDEYPDRSATLIIQVDSFEKGDELILEGPGIKTRRSLFLESLPNHFLISWARNKQFFPRGVDILFISQEGFVGLPRTTRINKGAV